MEHILAHTDGVPLFVEELTKMVLEGGLLRERDGEYVLEGPLPSLAIPTTLQASLMARLDRLSPVREVAQIGAVAGREFHYELAERRRRVAEGEIGRGARAVGAVGIGVLPGRNSARGIHLQARAGTGRRICRAPEKPPRASARRYCEGA